MLFDSHAHVTDNRFDSDRAEVLARAQQEGVSGILNAGADMASSAQAIALAKEYDFVYASVGVHPHDAKDVVEADYAQLAAWTQEEKVVAIGEIGLDYYYDLSPRDVQETVFVRQLDIARQTDMPFIIHDRDAHGDVLRILQQEAQGLTGVMHCFSGSWEMAQQVLKMGLYISVGGPLTFKNAAKLPEIVQKVPLERLLIETDCPYLTPQPYRGRRNEPYFVKFVAAEIARLRGMELEEVAKITSKNAKELFRITK